MCDKPYQSYITVPRFFSPRILEAEDLHNKLKFYVDTYLGPFDFTWLSKSADVKLSDRELVNFSIDATCGNVYCYVVPTDECYVQSRRKNWRSHIRKKKLLFDEVVFTFFRLLQQRHTTYGWKPGWSYQRRF